MTLCNSMFLVSYGIIPAWGIYQRYYPLVCPPPQPYTVLLLKILLAGRGQIPPANYTINIFYYIHVGLCNISHETRQKNPTYYLVKVTPNAHLIFICIIICTAIPYAQKLDDLHGHYFRQYLMTSVSAVENAARFCIVWYWLPLVKAVSYAAIFILPHTGTTRECAIL